MIKDKNLQQAIDYSEGQRNAAYMVLGEIVNLLNEFSDNIRVIGGWVPTLLYPDSEHIGSIDVDVDFLSGKYGGDGGAVSKHVDGIKTLPATGGNFAFEFPPTDVLIEYIRSDGARDSGHVNVVSVIPYLVMKAAALGRGKPKDAYDIYCTIDNYKGGVKALADEFKPYADRELVQSMCRKLNEKFASVEHAGPIDIVSFLGIKDDEEKERIRQDAYQKIYYLLSKLKGNW